MADTEHAATVRQDRSLDLTGHVFGRFTILALLALLAIAAWHRQTAIVTVLGLTLATIGVSRMWSRLSLRRIGCERSLSTHALFPGEQLLLTIRMSNQKILPLPWVELSQPIPPRLLHDSQDAIDDSAHLSRSLSMPWYSRLTWRQTITAQRRGYYVIPPLTLTSGDILGLYPRMADALSYDHVSVYPHLYPVRRLPLQRTDATGDLLGRTSLQEDPTRMRGIRDYQPHDGFRRVHWKASARHQSLKVKLHEPAALSQANLVLVADGFDTFADDTPFELAVSTAASTARYCIEHQMQIGLVSNVALVAGKGKAHLAPGNSNAHLIALLELLARATPSAETTFEVLSRRLREIARSGAALLIITGPLQSSQATEFERLGRSRCPLLVLEIGAEGSNARYQFPHRSIAGPDDLLDLGGI